MNKQEFLDALRAKISGLSEEDINERLSFYSEMIDDRVEDGKKEESAVKEIGTPDEIASQIIAETPMSKIVKNKVKSARKLSAWEIVIITLGFPVWFPLLLSAAVVVLALYISVWAIVVSLWAVFVSFAACAPAFLIAGIISLFMGQGAGGIIVIAGGFVCGGLGILSFFGCLETTKAVIKLAKLIVLLIKKSLVRRKEVKI